MDGADGRPLLSSLLNLPAPMNTSPIKRTVDTTKWVARKMPKLTEGDKLATVATLMDDWTRDENTRYHTAVTTLNDMVEEDKRIMDGMEHQLYTLQEAMITQQRVMVQMMRSMREMELAIRRDEAELQRLDPARRFGYAIGRDEHHIPHVFIVENPETLDPIDDVILDLLAEEEYDSDATVLEDV